MLFLVLSKMSCNVNSFVFLLLVMKFSRWLEQRTCMVFVFCFRLSHKFKRICFSFGAYSYNEPWLTTSVELIVNVNRVMHTLKLLVYERRGISSCIPKDIFLLGSAQYFLEYHTSHKNTQNRREGT